MAIKINNKDMSRRVYNDEDVQRVILNGSQIRPTEIPHIDYHIIGDFDGKMPGGWSGDVTIGDDGFSNGTATWNGMPSLLNARKVLYEIHFHWDGTQATTHYIPLVNGILGPYNNGCEINNYGGNDLRWKKWWNTDGGEHGYFGMGTTNVLPVGDYILSNNYELYTDDAFFIDYYIYDTLGNVVDVGYHRFYFSAEQTSKVKSSTYMNVTAGPGITISKIDFYIYNN